MAEKARGWIAKIRGLALAGRCGTLQEKGIALLTGRFGLWRKHFQPATRLLSNTAPGVRNGSLNNAIIAGTKERGPAINRAQNLPFHELEPLEPKGWCETGLVFEQTIAVEDTEFPGVVHRLRRIVLELDQPTREGETEIVLVTNLPAEVSALVCCEAYRGRWRIENHYQTLTDLLRAAESFSAAAP